MLEENAQAYSRFYAERRANEVKASTLATYLETLEHLDRFLGKAFTDA